MGILDDFVNSIKNDAQRLLKTQAARSAAETVMRTPREVADLVRDPSLSNLGKLAADPGAYGPALGVAVPLLTMLTNASQEASKVNTGALAYALASTARGDAALDPKNRSIIDAVQNTPRESGTLGGYISDFHALRSANEAYARGDERAVGLLNTALDPMNLLPLDKIRKLAGLTTRAERLAAPAVAKVLESNPQEAARAILAAENAAGQVARQAMGPGGNLAWRADATAGARALDEMANGLVRAPEPAAITAQADNSLSSIIERVRAIGADTAPPVVTDTAPKLFDEVAQPARSATTQAADDVLRIIDDNPSMSREEIRALISQTRDNATRVTTSVSHAEELQKLLNEHPELNPAEVRNLSDEIRRGIDNLGNTTMSLDKLRSSWLRDALEPGSNAARAIGDIPVSRFADTIGSTVGDATTAAMRAIEDNPGLNPNQTRELLSRIRTDGVQAIESIPTKVTDTVPGGISETIQKIRALSGTPTPLSPLEGLNLGGDAKGAAQEVIDKLDNLLRDTGGINRGWNGVAPETTLRQAGPRAALTDLLPAVEDTTVRVGDSVPPTSTPAKAMSHLTPEEMGVISGLPSEVVSVLPEATRAAIVAGTREGVSAVLKARMNPQMVNQVLGGQRMVNAGENILKTMKDNALWEASGAPGVFERKPLAQAAADAGVALDGTNVLEDVKDYVGTMADLLRHTWGVGWGAQKEAMAAKGGKVSFGALGRAWSKQIIETPRNALMDVGWGQALGLDAGLRTREMMRAQTATAKRILAGETDPVSLLENVSAAVDGLGIDLPTSAKAHEFTARLGVRPMNVESGMAKTAEELDALVAAGDSGLSIAQTGLNARQSAIAQVAFGLSNPTRAVTAIASLPFEAVAGYLAPLRSKVFTIINDALSIPLRDAAFQQAFKPRIEASARYLLEEARNLGFDTASLGGRGGLFSPEEVTKQFGEALGQAWKKLADDAVEAGFANAREIFGDFTTKLPGEKLASKFLPFQSWAWRAFPRAARIALHHPLVSYALLKTYDIDQAAAKAEGRPSYQVGTIKGTAINPIAGVALRVLSPQQESELRVNPLSFLSPLPPETLAGVGAEDKKSENLYQTVKNAMGAVGAQFNPLVQGAAYATGLDYRRPGGLSRYTGIDQILGNLPNSLGGTMPAIPTALLTGARKAVTGKPDNYDPVDAKARELVFERTGFPVDDSRNKEYALQIVQKKGIYKDAERIVNDMAGRRNILSLVSPVNTQVTSLTKVAERKAMVGVPFTKDEIYSMKDKSPELADAMQQVVDDWMLQHPDAAVQRMPYISKTELNQDPRITKWEAEHADIKYMFGPQYRRMRAEFIASLPKKKY